MSILKKRKTQDTKQSNAYDEYFAPASAPARDDINVFSAVEDVTGYLLLDLSLSMSSHLDELRRGFEKFRSDLMNSPAIDRVQRENINICIIGFGGGGAWVISDTAPVDRIAPPVLQAEGFTPLGQAINLALDMHQRRKAFLDSIGKARKRAWMYILTDGQPNDDYAPAVERLKNAVAGKSINAYIIGIGEDFDAALMQTIVTPERVLRIMNEDASLVFEFVSSSITKVSNSSPGQRVQFRLPDNMMTASV